MLVYTRKNDASLPYAFWPLMPGARPLRTWGRKLTEHIPPAEFGTYLLVGIWNTAFGYTTYAVLVYVLTPKFSHPYFAYTTAQVLSFFLNTTVAYLGYKNFVFKTKGNHLAEWMKCLSIYGIAAVPNLFILPILIKVLHDLLHLHRLAPYVAGALLTGVTVILSFLGNKRFTFKKDTNGSASSPQQEFDGI